MPQRHGFHGRFVGGGGSSGGGASLKAQQKQQRQAIKGAQKAQAKATKQINKHKGPKPPAPIPSRSKRKTSSKVKVNPKTLGVKAAVRHGAPARSNLHLIKGVIRVARKVG
jgi:hypothetical protein